MDKYAELEQELGITPQMMAFVEGLKTISRAEQDVFIYPSDIQGMGVRVGHLVPSSARVAMVNNGEFRTIYGRYMNHSDQPNAVFAPGADGSIDAIAVKDILPWDEVTVDYRTVMTAAARRNLIKIMGDML